MLDSTRPGVNNGKYAHLICIRSKEGFSTPCVDIKQWIHYFIKYLLENITIWDNYMIYGYNYCGLEHISIFHKRDTDHILASMSIISVSWSRIVTQWHATVYRCFHLTYLKKFLRRFRTLKPTPTSPLTRRGFHMTRGLIFIKK